MLIQKPADLRYSEVTQKSLYFNRRKFPRLSNIALN